MATEIHIHSLPRPAVVDTVYPLGVMIYDDAHKRVLIGDGTALNGLPLAMMADLQNVASSFLEYPFDALVAPDGSGFNKAGFNGELYVHHLVGPTGTIHTVASGDCEWRDGNTYLKMDDYMAAESLSEFSGDWIAVYNPRPMAQ